MVYYRQAKEQEKIKYMEVLEMKEYLYKCETIRGYFYSNNVADIKRKAIIILNPFFNSFDTVKIIDNKTGRYICNFIRQNINTPWGEWKAGKWI